MASTAEKIGMGVVGIGMITTATMPKRQTPGVINALSNFVQGVLGTAMGTRAGATGKATV